MVVLAGFYGMFNPMSHNPNSSDNALVLPVSLARLSLVLLIVACVYFFYGFIVPVLAALVIAFTTWPFYRRLVDATGGRRNTSATIALLASILFLIIPILIVGSYAIKEALIWLAWAIDANNYGAPMPVWLDDIPFVGGWLEEKWDMYLSHPGMIGEFVQITSGENIGSIYRGVLAASGSALNLALTVLFMLITLFFVYRDGGSFGLQLDRFGNYIFPMRWERLSRIVPAAVRATVLGMGVIAVGEGVILGAAYWVAGVPSPVMLGIITGIMAMIPGGAPLAFTSVSIYLMASGSPLAGILLFVWGSTELFIVDKFLRPRLVGGPIQLPFLPTFFGLVGGVKTMGFLGLFIGPVLMALIVMIWRESLKELSPSEESALPNE